VAIGNVTNISENLAASTIKAEVIAEPEHLLSTLKSPLEIEAVISSGNMPSKPTATQKKKKKKKNTSTPESTLTKNYCESFKSVITS